MATQDDVRRIAARLPGAQEGDGRFGFSVLVKGKAKGFVWSWAERVDPKKGRVPNDAVLAVLVRNLDEKEMILGSDTRKFFTESHYDGYPAVLVRLAEIEADELEDLIVESWRCKATPELLTRLDEP